MNTRHSAEKQPIGGGTGRKAQHVLFRPHSIPAKAHKLVKRLFVEMNAQQCSQQQMSARSGVNKNTFKDWRTRTNPTLDNLEACFNVLGLELTVREKRGE